ncbi:N-acetylglucosamine kinase [Deinococcus radiotolerans]|uniref:ATPase BadF/BadG/BcrA/BcrD type domain-containing protein n=1 Tax=Deinococcus radiotolerans TaxID=1309407 RepID=A0ABQ2FLP6_9DEIO|nr:BadF/BadG/BcrA/BcrD ATPase family protein [Deinococcus radiotolerans]GGL00825.1 hypothetical protein GCM10010844_19120 [Deinococcus radiotolerans]
MTITLGLDLGGSRSKWHATHDDATQTSGSAPPLTAALLGTAQGRENLRALVADLPGRPRAVHAGLPGYGAGRPDAAAIQALLADAFGVPATQLVVESDIELAYRAHFQPGEGVLVYAGTGSVACHLTPDGQLLRAGGHGYHIDDDGAGYALGRAALRWLTRHLDRNEEPAGALATEMRALTSALDWDTVRHFTYGTPGASAVASLAPAVGRAADQGDPVALGILTQAAAVLADLAQTVQHQLPRAIPVVVTGGSLRVSPLFGQAVQQAVPGAAVRFQDHARAAAQLAERLIPAHS